MRAAYGSNQKHIYEIWTYIHIWVCVCVSVSNLSVRSYYKLVTGSGVQAATQRHNNDTAYLNFITLNNV